MPVNLRGQGQFGDGYGSQVLQDGKAWMGGRREGQVGLGMGGGRLIVEGLTYQAVDGNREPLQVLEQRSGSAKAVLVCVGLDWHRWENL